jgi:hypothetical protein
MGTDSEGNYDRTVQGAAGRNVQEAAARAGVSSGQMTRATAITSPQMGWKSEGQTKDPQASMPEKSVPTAGVSPNLMVAEHAMRESNGRNPALPPEQGPSFPYHRTNPGHGVESIESVGGLPDHITKAKNHQASSVTHGRESLPYPIAERNSQKAPNFDASLSLSHIDPAVQRVASTAYTVDRHDADSLGLDANSNEFKATGVYESIASMSGRAAHAQRELAPNAQSMVWEDHRNSKGLGQGNQMFTAGTGFDGSTPVPRPELRATTSNQSRAARPVTRSQRRAQSTADRMGLEF